MEENRKSKEYLENLKNQNYARWLLTLSKHNPAI